MSDTLPPVIKLQNLTKVFSTEEVETHALSNITLEIPRGDYVSIAGPSGCGKSTLLSILGLLDSPTSGRGRSADRSRRSSITRTRVSSRNRAWSSVTRRPCPRSMTRSQGPRPPGSPSNDAGRGSGFSMMAPTPAGPVTRRWPSRPACRGRTPRPAGRPRARGAPSPGAASARRRTGAR